MGLFDLLNKEDPEKKLYERILQECDQALALNEKDPDLWNKKCLVLRELGLRKDAIEAGEIAVQLAPNDPDVWDSLRLCYAGDWNKEKADECQKHVSDLLKQKKDAESQRLMQEGSGKECCRCGVYVRENIRCVSCGSYFCPDCYRDHQSMHSKPRIGISYHSNGLFSGYD